MWEAIKKRISVRSYKKKPLSKKDKIKVNETLKAVEKKRGPFKHQVRFFFVEDKNNEETKIGTYGFIKNPPSFIGGVVKNTTKGMIDFGFLFEEVILRLTEADLKTVWLGGTYHRSDFDVETTEDEIIAAVSPVGYKSSQSFREKIIRGFSRGNKRKSFDDLFFMGKDLVSINQKHQYHKYLEAVQAAPSASNKQPWRIVVIDDTFHLYLERTKKYGNSLKIDIQAVDMGIALSHLYLTLKADNLSPEFVEENPSVFEDKEYILSIKINK